MRPSVQDIRMGAIYRVCRDRRLGRDTVETLLADRAGLKTESAKTLAGHWMGAFAAHYKYLRSRGAPLCMGKHHDWEEIAPFKERCMDCGEIK